MTTLLQVDQISVKLGSQLVLQQLSFALQAGEIACLLGPSGCGKTTLLRCIGGLQHLDSGMITLRGQISDTPTTQLRPELRHLGFVFQDLALFPHLSAEKNIALGLRSLSAEARAERVMALLNQFHLTEFAARLPHELSGGQQQRVAIARALAPQHGLVLLDEPFSSLDAKLRVALSRDLRRQLKAQNCAAIMVSHDQEEGLVCADRIGVMHQGRLIQWGSPFEVYCAPASPFVAEFIGEGVWLDATANSNGLETHLGHLLLPGASIESKMARVLVRPEDIVEADEAAQGVTVSVIHSEFRGAQTVYRLRVGPELPDLLMSAPHRTPWLDGSHHRVRFNPSHPVWFLR
jgi:iron(III) transport system ATP-binding protein